MAKVYVLQVPNRRDRTTNRMVPVFDVSPAMEFGDIVHVLPSTASFYATIDLLSQLRSALRDFNPDEDYVVAAGDPSVIASAAAMLGHDHGRFQLLKWDRQMARYISLEIKV